MEKRSKSGVKPEMKKDFRAVIADKELKIGTVLIINEKRYEVKKSTKILLSYNPAKNVFTAREGWRYYSLPGTQKKFLEILGYSDLRHFMDVNMRDAKLIFGFAEKYVFFIDLYEPCF